MLVGCGINDKCQLGIKKADYVIDPAVIPIDASKIKKISSGFMHSVVLFDDGSVYVAGSTIDRIICNYPPKIFSSFTKIEITGDQIIDIVCGNNYVATLDSTGSVYLKNNKKVKGVKAMPVLISGGIHYPAVADENGCLYILKHEFPLEIDFGKKIINIALCCDFRLYVQTEDGILHESNGYDLASLKFHEEESLKGEKIIQMSGYFAHIVVLTDNNKVYAKGSNSNGELGIGNTEDHLDSFVEVPLPLNLKVVRVRAAVRSTFVLFEDGLLYSCGINNCGNLFLNCRRDEKHSLMKTCLSNVKDVFCGEHFTFSLVDK